MTEKDDYVNELRNRQKGWSEPEEETVIIAIQKPKEPIPEVKPKARLTSVRLTTDILNWLDDKVDRGEFINRSEAIRFYLKTARDTD